MTCPTNFYAFVLIALIDSSSTGRSTLEEKVHMLLCIVIIAIIDRTTVGIIQVYISLVPTRMFRKTYSYVHSPFLSNAILILISPF